MQGGSQELILGRSCFHLGIILHELMHALGFFHEHCRPDRDESLIIFYENIMKDKIHNFDKVANKEYKMGIPFDYDSIMIYGETAFSKNGEATMFPIESYWRILDPQYKIRLSALDIISLKAFYNCVW